MSGDTHRNLVVWQVKQLNDSNWKERQAALQKVLSALKENSRLTPGVGRIIEGLRPRLKDHQQAICTMALECLCLLAQGVGKAIKLHIKAVVPEILACVGDSKQQVVCCQ